MGDPTPDPDDREGCKCVFNEPGCWTKSGDWDFDEDVAVFGPLDPAEDHKLTCPLAMVVGRSYTFHFEIYDANFFGDDALVLRISSDPASHSLEMRINAEYYITLEYKEAGYPIEFFVETVFNDPDSFKIKNFTCEGIASSTAYTAAMYPVSGTKNEVVLTSQSEVSVLLAHWRDKTNCLIKHKT